MMLTVRLSRRVTKIAATRITLCIVALLLGSMPAYAHYCGNDVEPAFNASTTLPNGQPAAHLVNAWWWFPNNESGGMPSAVVHGQHRYCGEMAAYIYIGDTPQSQVWFAVPLDPTIVANNVAQAKCTAMLERTNDVYYFGYNDGGDWPYYQEVRGAESWSDGTQTWKAFYIYGGDNLNPRSTYSVSMICPPNLHE